MKNQYKLRTTHSPDYHNGGQSPTYYFSTIQLPQATPQESSHTHLAHHSHNPNIIG